MNLKDIIGDVSRRLYWDDGEEITPEVTSEILRGIRRIFDRFSIDGRKLTSICEVEHVIRHSKSSLTLGRGKDFDLWGLPEAIYHAAWRYTDESECFSGRGFFNPLCDDPIRVHYNDGDFHYNHVCNEQFYGRPGELYYQRGEIVFSSLPCVGDKLILRVKMPFDVRLSGCEIKHPDNKYQFKISPSHKFDMETRRSIYEEARDKFDESPDWCLETYAIPCGGSHCNPERVLVTAVPVKQNSGEIVTTDSDLPDGYASALYDILVYDLAPVAGVDVTQDMKIKRDTAIQLLHRLNADPIPLERDYTTPWSMRGHYHEDYYDETGAAHSGRGCRA